jgi:hypothetical protein
MPLSIWFALFFFVQYINNCYNVLYSSLIIKKG